MKRYLQNGPEWVMLHLQVRSNSLIRSYFTVNSRTSVNSGIYSLNGREDGPNIIWEFLQTLHLLLLI